MALDASKQKQKGTGRVEQDLIPLGVHPARVVQVLDLGLQPRKAYKGKEKPPVYQLWITYELAYQFMKDKDGNDQKDQPRWISERMNVFTRDQENATSTKRLNNLDPANEVGNNWAAVVGFPCLVQIVHSKDGKYANVGSVLPPMAGQDVPELVNPSKFFDLDDPDMTVFNGLPEFLQKMMKENLEFEGSALAKALDAGEGHATEEEPEVEDEDEEAPY